MIWSLTPRRRHDPELMDTPGLPESEVSEAYRVLERVNRQLGNVRTMKCELLRFVGEERRPGQSAVLTLLDIGSGAGDIPRALCDELDDRGVPVLAITVDRDPTAVALAHHQRLHVVRGDALRLPMGDASIDLVTAIKMAHHFSGESLCQLLREMARVARRRVVVLDIRRHWLAYWGFMAWSRLWTTNRLVRYDGPLSVLRGFTPGELLELTTALPAFAWTLRSYAGFQLALVGRRRDPGPVDGAGRGDSASPGGSPAR